MASGTGTPSAPPEALDTLYFEIEGPHYGLIKLDKVSQCLKMHLLFQPWLNTPIISSK